MDDRPYQRWPQTALLAERASLERAHRDALQRAERWPAMSTGRQEQMDTASGISAEIGAIYVELAMRRIAPGHPAESGSGVPVGIVDRADASA